MALQGALCAHWADARSLVAMANITMGVSRVAVLHGPCSRMVAANRPHFENEKD